MEENDCQIKYHIYVIKIRTNGVFTVDKIVGIIK